ncbi:MAG TPA: glycosyltransferase [Candidatus Saccharimonadales bacterium]|nr:glycosyltransferase [Candidatus Saccharimonadales bacterium]
MKVLMQGRTELFAVGGGDKVQIEKTAEQLRNLGVEVDIRTEMNLDLSQYDIVHVFQLDWTPETFFFAQNAKKYNKPLVLSPIHHSVKEVKKFDDEYAFDFRRLSRFLFNDQHKRDTFKNVYRSFFVPTKAIPTIKSVFMGLENMHKKTLQMADIVLVQTDAEAQDLQETYNVNFKWAKIPNGVGNNFLNTTNFKNIFGVSDYILSVGRIEPRKNQLKIIEAVANFRKKHNLDVNLVLIGVVRYNRHPEFSLRFKNVLAKYNWIKHLASVPYNDMPSVYHFAKVTVSASWFETTGLTSLESLFCGTNAVAAGERAKEYLKDYVSYCTPDSVESIELALEKEFFAPRPILAPEILREYTWENAAKKTLAIYKNFSV